jgi:geranylgeranyl pyrophosphate synthase
MTTPFDSQLAAYHGRIERVLVQCLELPDCGTARLRDAMRYSVLGGGKRVRPVLLYATGESLGAPLELLDAPAAAVELVHVYSLVHDDLPAMDDDDLRRGRPTCHKAFDEATAILAGDALQALAFGVLAGATAADPDDISPSARLGMLRVLAGSAGTGGMAGGQAIDLASVGQTLSASEVENMHRRKTGALIKGSVLIGALAAGLTAGEDFTALERYGTDIGLAFQIQDDILDIEGDAAVLGKSTGADAARRKPTYPSTAGIEAARERAVELRDSAIRALVPLGPRSRTLAALAHYMVDRAT